MSTVPQLTSREIARQVLQRTIVVFVVCLGIGFATASFVFRQPPFIPTVYSLSIGMTSYAFIELFVYCWRASGRSTFNGHWPVDPGGPIVTALGCALGFFLGHAIADRIVGLSSWNDPETIIVSALLSAIAGSGLSYFYVSRGKAQLAASQVKAAEAAANEARLRLLESQLNPHMLFNALANLRALIPAEPSKAQAMLDQINSYLRSSLSASRTSMQSLEQEMNRLQAYLGIMQTRLGKRLEFSIDLPAELKAMSVPSLILQPLVENAIVHGIEPSPSGGRLQVRAAKTDRGLTLQVLASHEAQGPIRTDDNLRHEGQGLGVSNVEQRLLTVYGASASFSLDLGPTQSLATIHLPNTANQ